jgi:hypothetical protein
MSLRHQVEPIRCPACDSFFTVRTSEYFETHMCLNCDEAWTTKRVEAPQEKPSTRQPRAAESARGILAALKKTPPPSPQEISAMFAKARKEADPRKRAPKKPRR